MKKKRFVALIKTAMKVTFTQALFAIILTCSSYAKNAAGQGVLNKEVSLSVSQKEIKQVLKEVQNQTDVKFIYSPSAIKADRKISMAVKDKPLIEFLNEDLEALYINYRLMDGKILLFYKDDQAKLSAEATGESAPSRVTVTGTVTSSKGEPLPGVSVKVKGAATGASTDVSGRFSLNVPDAGAILVFTYIGFTTREVPLNGQTNITVQLMEESTELNEVVVIGYQTVRKRDLTGAASVVNATQAAKVSSNSVAEAIQGLSPGVTVRNTGVPGDNASIEIRGVASFQSTSPLYVIDGMIADANITINNNDIESIQILKDASAAAIYGARAANGVVIITTRQGREGPAKVDFSAKYGGQQIPKRWDVMNNTEYAAMKRTQYANSGLAAPSSVAEATFNPSINTDWQDEALHNGNLQDYNLSLSGGSKTGTYLISGSYLDNTGYVIGNSFNRASLRVNTTAKKGIVSFGENMVLTNSNRKLPATGNPMYDMAEMLPVIPVQGESYVSATNPEGYGIGTNDAVTYAYNSVAVRNLNPLRYNYAKLVGNAYLGVKLTDWLNYKFNTGLEVSFDYSQNIRKIGVWQYNAATYPSSVTEERSRFASLLLEHTLNFNKVINKHSINGVVGVTMQHTTREFTAGGRSNLTTSGDDYYTSIQSATGTMTSDGGTSTDYKILGYIGRVNYAYNDKYLLTVTTRNDQDSRFGSNYRTAFFPSVAGAWRISKEPFFKVNWVNDLKLSASYGKLGITPVSSSWPYAAYINNNPRAIFGSDQTANVGAYQAQLANPDLHWETRIQQNAGLEGTLFNNRVSFELNVYNSLSKDAILPLPVPGYLGNLGGNPYVNTASIRNRGIEFTATYRNNNHPLKWDVSGNITTIKNKVESVGSMAGGINYLSSGNTRSQVGGHIGEWYVLKTEGLFQSDAEAKNYKSSNGTVIQPNAKAGDVKYVDLNDDGTINTSDRMFLGSPWPTLQSGLQFNASYKQFSCNIQLVGVFGYKVYNDVKRILDSYQNTNFRSDVSPWSSTNTNTSDPRIGLESSDRAIVENNYSYSDRWLEDASYVRLRNLEFGYAVPKNLLNRVGMSNARVFVSGQNLLTFTGYSGLDPDVTGSNIQERGIDNGHWPSPRVFSIGFTGQF